MVEELYHHGVKGMKWGVRKNRFENTQWGMRDVLKARRDYKKSTNKNPDAIKKIKKNNLRRLHMTTTRQGEHKVIYEGKKAVINEKLLQAGYSKKAADAGSKWMVEHGYNIDWSDGNNYSY